MNDFLEEETKCGFLITVDRKKLWKAELDIMEYVDKICCNHNLKYFVLDGALIGAIRHDGFIPWDDDIDIGMLREDYEKFLKVAQHELPPYYFLQDGINEKDYYDSIVRIRDTRTTGILRKDINKKCNNGIFIEIYPFDSVTSNPKQLKKQRWKINLLVSMLFDMTYGISEGNYNIKGILIHFVCNIMKFFCSKEMLDKKLKKIASQYNKDGNKYVDELVTKYDCKYLLTDVEETVYHRFEYLQLQIPKGYDNCLKKTFGDYMKLPSENERNEHHNRVVYYNPDYAFDNPEIIKKANEYFKTK